MKPFEWEPLSVAAKRLGRTVGRLRHWCLEGRIPEGQSRKARLSSGHFGWRIRSDFRKPLTIAAARTARPATVRADATRTVRIVPPPGVSSGPIIIHIHTPGRVILDLFGSGSKGG